MRMPLSAPRPTPACHRRLSVLLLSVLLLAVTVSGTGPTIESAAAEPAPHTSKSGTSKSGGADASSINADPFAEPDPFDRPVAAVRPREWREFECVTPLGQDVISGKNAPGGKGLLQMVEEQYERIHDLAADFRQLSYFLGTDRSQESGGKVYFLRPGKMDWVYRAPDEQRFVSDSANVWWYQPSQGQVTIRRLDQSFVSDVPVSFLLGVGKLHESFRLESACTSASGTVLTLLPQKPNASLDKFLLLVDDKDRSPRGARILDVGGNETSIVFESIGWNKGVEEARFHFEIPKGTDIIDERNTASAVAKRGAREGGK